MTCNYELFLPIIGDIINKLDLPELELAISKTNWTFQRNKLHIRSLGFIICTNGRAKGFRLTKVKYL